MSSQFEGEWSTHEVDQRPFLYRHCSRPPRLPCNPAPKRRSGNLKEQQPEHRETQDPRQLRPHIEVDARRGNGIRGYTWASTSKTRPPKSASTHHPNPVGWVCSALPWFSRAVRGGSAAVRFGRVSGNHYRTRLEPATPCCGARQGTTGRRGV